MFSTERFRVKVHRKGLIVIPASIRRRLGISEGSYIELVVDRDGIRIVVPQSLRDAFGVDGDKALKVVELIGRSRREKVEKEIRF